MLRRYFSPLARRMLMMICVREKVATEDVIDSLNYSISIISSCVSYGTIAMESSRFDSSYVKSTESMNRLP